MSRALLEIVMSTAEPISDSGGGGERVLWSAIAYLQRTQPDVVSMVYTGDFPRGGKAEDKDRIIHNVKVS